MIAKKPITILFDANPITNANRSGVGHYSLGLITALAEAYPDELSLIGYSFDLFGRNNKKLPFHQKNIEHITIRFMPGKLLSLFRLFGLQPPIELFVHKKTDLQLFTNFVALPSIRKTPKVTVLYDMVFFDYPQYVRKRNLDFMVRFVPSSVKNSELIITISEFTKQRILNYFPDSVAEIAVTPIPPVESAIRTSTKLQNRLLNLGVNKGGYILYVGTIEPRKNIENLVRGYILLPKKIQERYSLVLAGGKGWMDESILKLISTEQKKGKKIILPGYISEHEKRALYANASLFTLASHYEGFGMPVLEAMQQKIPVAVCNIPVFKEIAGDAAFYFDKDDPQDIANVLELAICNKTERKKILLLADEKLKQYSWSSNAKIVFEAILKINNKKSNCN